jgi:hypothetical protein
MEVLEDADDMRFQYRNCGEVRYEIDHVPGFDEKYIPDDIAGIEIRDAKYAKPQFGSPYRSEIDPRIQPIIDGQQANEMRKAKALIDDPASPFDKLVIIYNDARSIPYFQARAHEAGLPLSQLEFRQGM